MKFSKDTLKFEWRLRFDLSIFNFVWIVNTKQLYYVFILHLQLEMKPNKV